MTFAASASIVTVCATMASSGSDASPAEPAAMNWAPMFPPPPPDRGPPPRAVDLCARGPPRGIAWPSIIGIASAAA